MKWIFIVTGLLLALGFITFVAMAIYSHKTPANLGLQQGLLRPCPDSPNCVCSEAHSQASQQHAIRPINLADRSWVQMKSIMVAQGGVIEQDDGHYLHATFTTPVFRYVDDVELRLDEQQGVIHIRSASRVGHSDFGVNRKRVEQLSQ
ncbi:DUF1499 domain-containing protein [Mariprofundus erugo]|uniref:DUF1499 domain-containing protein n=1 Tax=Mariprofundus erugo TaxID=2528639 RepID=A0A5R9GRJ3_9PROT|nr:DUF1499 domain-containing protein [Mariprofundus erugo]TLS67549.1 DUF1499 domain-containing protein [Mariprofundus erugo]